MGLSHRPRAMLGSQQARTELHPSNFGIRPIGRMVASGDALLDIIRSFVFAGCVFFVLFLLFSPFLLATDESGKMFKPFGLAWILFGLVCCAFLVAAVFAPT
jgi:hypothetical protein